MTDRLSYSRTLSGDLAVYLGNRRVGTIVNTARTGCAYAYIPAGKTKGDGTTFRSEAEVQRSLVGEQEG